MLDQAKIYKSVLEKLSALPVAYLSQVDNFLTLLKSKAKEETADRRAAILNLAGSWADMSDQEFREFLKEVEETRSQMFNREVEL